jgi:hypothetical protein
MKIYVSYQKAKIDNPEYDIYKINELFTTDSQVDGSPLDLCNPADHCMTVEQFLKAGHSFSIGDIIMDSGVGTLERKAQVDAYNKCDIYDNDRYILRAASLKEKDEVVNVMVEDFNVQDLACNYRGRVARVCAALYDAGYRKVN